VSKNQIWGAGLSPNSIMLTFIETSLRGKSRTHIMKVRDTNGEKSWNHEVSVKISDTNHLDMSRCLQQSLWQIRLCRS